MLVEGDGKLFFGHFIFGLRTEVGDEEVVEELLLFYLQALREHFELESEGVQRRPLLICEVDEMQPALLGPLHYFLRLGEPEFLGPVVQVDLYFGLEAELGQEGPQKLGQFFTPPYFAGVYRQEGFPVADAFLVEADGLGVPLQEVVEAAEVAHFDCEDAEVLHFLPDFGQGLLRE